jgi:hypothetical protein
MRSATAWRILLWTGIAAFALSPAAADAQAPPYYYPPSYPPPAPVAVPPALPASPQAAEIAGCLCLGRDIGVARADMAAKRRAYNEMRSDLTRLDQRLQRERAALDVNDPDAVARFRQMLQQRDALFRRSTGPEASELATAVSRYNATSNDYNARCANQPRDPVLLAQVQATLACPAP